jgi:hypothetical protein
MLASLFFTRDQLTPQRLVTHFFTMRRWLTVAFQVKLPPYLLDEVGDQLAANIHEVWSVQKIRGGWKFAVVRDDAAKLHPMLIPYDELSDVEKAYDLDMAVETLKVLQVCRQ